MKICQTTWYVYGRSYKIPGLRSWPPPTRELEIISNMANCGNHWHSCIRNLWLYVLSVCLYDVTIFFRRYSVLQYGNLNQIVFLRNSLNKATDWKANYWFSGMGASSLIKWADLDQALPPPQSRNAHSQFHIHMIIVYRDRRGLERGGIGVIHRCRAGKAELNWTGGFS